jgi:hypothetical protein
VDGLLFLFHIQNMAPASRKATAATPRAIPATAPAWIPIAAGCDGEIVSIVKESELEVVCKVVEEAVEDVIEEVTDEVREDYN